MALFRRRQGTGEGTTGDRTDDSVDLSEQEHAWWANSRVQHAPVFPEPDGREAAEAAEADPFATTTQPGTPWGFTDVFAADVDGAIGRELGDAAAEPDPVEDGRSLADVFALEAAFRTLGLEPGAPWDEVVLAHRRIAKRCHPDRLVHADDETRRRGEQEMIDANAAYERLRAQQRPSPHSSGLFTR